MSNKNGVMKKKVTAKQGMPFHKYIATGGKPSGYKASKGIKNAK